MTAEQAATRHPGTPRAVAASPPAGQQQTTQPPVTQPPNQCLDEVCVTCSDTAIAVTVVRLLASDLAVVDTGAGEEEVSVALVVAAVGDTILVHAGEAIAVVGK